MNKFTRLLFSLAKTQAAGSVVRSCFAHWSYLLPVKRLYETPFVVAFYHPKPAYPQHVVIVPKKAIPDLQVLGVSHPEYAAAIWNAAQEIVSTLQWEQGTYVLCANGGPRQEVQQVHFHLFCGEVPAREPLSEAEANILYSDAGVQAVGYPQSDGRLHIALMLQPQGTHHADREPEASHSAYTPATAILRILPSLDQQLHLVQRGYTLHIDSGMDCGYIAIGSEKRKA